MTPLQRLPPFAVGCQATVRGMKPSSTHLAAQGLQWPIFMALQSFRLAGRRSPRLERGGCLLQGIIDMVLSCPY